MDLVYTMCVLTIWFDGSDGISKRLYCWICLETVQMEKTLDSFVNATDHHAFSEEAGSF